MEKSKDIIGGGGGCKVDFIFCSRGRGKKSLSKTNCEQSDSVATHWKLYCYPQGIENCCIDSTIKPWPKQKRKSKAAEKLQPTEGGPSLNSSVYVPSFRERRNIFQLNLFDK